MKTLTILSVLLLAFISVNSYSQVYPKQIRINYTTSTNLAIDNIVIRFYNDPSVNTTTESRTFDTRTLNCCTYIASLKGTTELAIQTRPLTFLRDTVKLLVASTQQGSFKLNFSNFENFTEAKEIWLLDTYLGTQVNVKLQPTYFFVIAGAGSQGTSRFKMVFVQDPISIACPSNIVTNNLPGFNGNNVTYNVAATSVCGAATVNYSIAPGSFFPLGTTNVTVNASDSCGNISSCNFLVTVNDIEPPLLSTISDLSFTVNTGLCSYSFTPAAPTATDNSGNATVTGSRNDGLDLTAPYPKGNTTITWTAIDASGNTATTAQLINVVDDNPPTLQFTTSQQQNVVTYGCSYTPSGNSIDPLASDNCGAVTLSNNYNNQSSLAGVIFNAGTTIITWTATDASGNTASIQQTITVSDNQPPVIAAKNLLANYFTNNTGCTYKVAGTEFDPTASDNCSAVQLTNNINNTGSLAGVVLPTGLNKVIWTAKDAKGNTSTWTENINVASSLNITIPDAYVLPSGAKINTLYIGYSPASILTLNAAGTGANSFKWSVTSNLTIVGANNTSSVKIASNSIGTSPYKITLTTTNAIGCTAVTSKNIEVLDVRCGTKNDKVVICSPLAKSTCVTVNSTLTTQLASGYTLGDCSISARGISNINEMQVNPTLSVYPNPAKGFFVINLQGYKPGKAEVIIIDMLGRTVKSESININQNKEQLSIDIRNKPSGVYTVRVSTSDGVQLIKVVVAE